MCLENGSAHIPKRRSGFGHSVGNWCFPSSGGVGYKLLLVMDRKKATKEIRFKDLFLKGKGAPYRNDGLEGGLLGLLLNNC